MCGISLVIERSGSPASAERVEAMNNAVLHRGPDAEGVSIRGAVGLGHRRLSILDLRHRADQPMTRGQGSIVYNGEIYNFAEVRAELEGLGRRFQTASDTEVLVEALNTWWVDALPRLNGMFAFAYHNEARGQVLLGRDRFAEKPLVYARTDRRFYAASEAKQILAAGEVRPRLNQGAALAFLLDAELNRSAETLFEDVTELRGGHYAVYDLPSGTLNVRRWYDLPARITRSSADYPTAREQVSAMLRDAVRLRHMSDVPLGACLSGGIDSSAICAISSGLVADRGAFKVFTCFHPGDGYDERAYSRQVVERFGFQSIEVQPSLEDLFTEHRMREMAWRQDQPLPSGSHFNEYMVMRAARDAGVVVVLDGQGADEYFGGYWEYWEAAQADHLRSLDMSAFFRGLELRAEMVGESRTRVLKNFVRSAATAPASSRPHWRPRDATRPPRVSRGLAPGVFDLSIEAMVTTSLPYQLHSLDRHSMHWSVEGRLPMTDYRLVELVLSLPSEYKVGRGFQKRILRDATPELPEPIARRKSKLGYNSPDGEFMRRRPEVVRSMLRAATAFAAPLIATGAVMDSFEAMVEGRLPYDNSFFRLISFHAWAEAFGVVI